MVEDNLIFFFASGLLVDQGSHRPEDTRLTGHAAAAKAAQLAVGWS